MPAATDRDNAIDISVGRITIDGQDAAVGTQQSPRKAIGTVPQDCNLLQDYLVNAGPPSPSCRLMIMRPRMPYPTTRSRQS